MARKTTIISSAAGGGGGGAVILGGLGLAAGLLAIDHHYSSPGHSAFDKLTRSLRHVFGGVGHEHGGGHAAGSVAPWSGHGPPTPGPKPVCPEGTWWDNDQQTCVSQITLPWPIQHTGYMTGLDAPWSDMTGKIAGPTQAWVQQVVQKAMASENGQTLQQLAQNLQAAGLSQISQAVAQAAQGK